MAKIDVLQIGPKDWQEIIAIDQEQFRWTFLQVEELENFAKGIKEEEQEAKKLQKLPKQKPFQAVLVEDINQCLSLSSIGHLIEPYSVLYNQEFPPVKDEIVPFVEMKKAKAEDFSNLESLMQILSQNFFSGQYGEKNDISSIQVDPNFEGSVEYVGSAYLSLTGQYGQGEFSPLLSWVYSSPIRQNQLLEMWLEYLVGEESDCELQLELQLIPLGSPSHIIARHLFSQKDLEQPIRIRGEQHSTISASLWVKGSGNLKIGALHLRFSRGDYGKFLLGGQRLVDQNRQELFYYFHPGDLKPPLNVYFSGYRSAEGFEGYFLMKSFESPFLLITDPRLEGGAFYMGSRDLEEQVLQVIREHLTTLGFTEKDLILSGLSMGTFGALYYGSLLSPHAIIIGKPLVNIGNIAGDARLIRPNEFDTSFDILRHLTGQVTNEAVEQLNQHFWKVFDQANFSDTQLAISYMRHDDYDLTAYIDILEHLGDKRTKVISKGIDGRHNDATPAITSWFIAQYENIMRADFGRNETSEV